MDAKEVLRNANTILVIDWPSKDVPETLTRMGFRVFVRGGPGPEDYSAYEISGAEIVSRRTGRRPDGVGLVYSYRPVAELAQTIAEAKAVGAKAVWMQSGISPEGQNDPKACWMPEEVQESVRRQVQGAGLELITEPYIVAVAREITRSK